MATGEGQRLGNGQSEFSPVPGDAFVMLYQDGTGHIGFVLRVVKARNATAFKVTAGIALRSDVVKWINRSSWDSSINILRGRKKTERLEDRLGRG